ncbi:hypothetical protein SAMN02745975_03719 [Geosporobacter subterraneus DSM 17957]|uniref:Thioredoxin n=1 Tax=Geosporobacter subterraneus DSM 17957 TaxID=1121919 RepID=A0A1M6PYG8_9FIRM|nr:hypothetical protein [Geosporobacter subterraneus]SHK12980.1 hypothetical protein SAMN02745975_03719 [Geosporobacter subterraneus DSM 17957]
MKKYKWMILFTVIVAISGIILMKNITKTNTGSSTEKYETLEAKVNHFEKSSKIKIVMYSTETDCCPDLEKFYNNYNYKSTNLLKEYNGKIEGLLINKKSLNESDLKTAATYEKKYNIKVLPTLIIFDYKNIERVRIVGDYQASEVKNTLERMLSEI